MPFWRNCRNFGVNEINDLGGSKLQASGQIAPRTGSDGVFTQPGSKSDLQRDLEHCRVSAGKQTFGAQRPECAGILADAEREGWSVRDLKAEIRQRKNLARFRQPFSETLCWPDRLVP